MKKIFLIVPAVLCAILLFGQDKSYSTEGNRYFTEAALRLSTADMAWKTIKQPVSVSFASSNTRYAKEKVPPINIRKSWSTKAWEGENVPTPLLVWTTQPIEPLTCVTGKLENSKGGVIPEENIRTGFIGM